MEFPLPAPVRLAMEKLGNAGFRSDIVGGCVRDFLRGAVPHDFDMTTSATPPQMQEVFRDFRTIETGIRHGTLTVLVEGMALEITTWRVDGGYTDHRHPAAVTFTRSLAEDLARRDFTVNAMCYNPTDGLTDLYGGREDLATRRVRAVGEPSRRFDEDALRILRALRFASVLDFSIEKETSLALTEKRELLRAVSAERIFAEWQKLLCGGAAPRILAEYAPVVSVFLPEIASAAAPALAALPPDFTQRFLYLFAAAGREDPATDFAAACERLRTPAALRRHGTVVLSRLTPAPHLSDRELRHILYDIGVEDTGLLLSLRRAFGAPEEETSRMGEILSGGTLLGIGDLAVGGEDLVALGYRGAAVGEAQRILAALVLDGVCPNEKTALIGALTAAGKDPRGKGESHGV